MQAAVNHANRFNRLGGQEGRTLGLGADGEVLGPQDLAQLQVTDFEMIEAGTRLPAGYDCFRTP